MSGKKSAIPPLLRILTRVVEGEGGCWLVTGGGHSDGYAMTSDGLANRHIYAHRLSYEAFVGPIPSDMVIDHLCHRRRCVNPDHMRVCTRVENSQRSLTSMKTACPHGHDWNDPANVSVNNRGHRYCKECSRIRARQYKAPRGAGR